VSIVKAIDRRVEDRVVFPRMVAMERSEEEEDQPMGGCRTH
jgi:hypothetical protein